MKIISTQYWAFCLFFFISISSFAQKSNPDRLANRNEQLELLLLEYKEELVKANKKITKLTQENSVLKRKINQLLKKQIKTEQDINQLKIERNTLLQNNKVLQRTIAERKKNKQFLTDNNERLELDNQLLQNATKLLEEAAIASDTIQKYQELTIVKQRKGLNSLIQNYAQDCTILTGRYKIPFSRDKLNIMFGDDFSKFKELESLTISACYQIQKPISKSKILVYFHLYENDKQNVIKEIMFPLNKTNADDSVIYFEGKYTIPTDGKDRLSNNKTYFYEVRYREEVIAKGTLKSS